MTEQKFPTSHNLFLRVNSRFCRDPFQSADFDWNSEECALIISIFSVGQTLFSIPAGWLASKCGGVKVTGISTALGSLLTALTPVILFHQVYVMITLRLLIGILQVGTLHLFLSAKTSRLMLPFTMQVMILVNMTDVTARWIPPKERARVVGFSIAGANCGSAFCYLLSGYLAHFWRWPFIFYVTGMYSRNAFIINKFSFSRSSIENSTRFSRTVVVRTVACFHTRMPGRRSLDIG